MPHKAAQILVHYSFPCVMILLWINATYRCGRRCFGEEKKTNRFLEFMIGLATSAAFLLLFAEVGFAVLEFQNIDIEQFFQGMGWFAPPPALASNGVPSPNVETVRAFMEGMLATLIQMGLPHYDRLTALSEIQPPPEQIQLPLEPIQPQIQQNPLPEIQDLLKVYEVQHVERYEDLTIQIDGLRGQVNQLLQPEIRKELVDEVIQYMEEIRQGQNQDIEGMMCREQNQRVQSIGLETQTQMMIQNQKLEQQLRNQQEAVKENLKHQLKLQKELILQMLNKLEKLMEMMLPPHKTG